MLAVWNVHVYEEIIALFCMLPLANFSILLLSISHHQCQAVKWVVPLEWVSAISAFTNFLECIVLTSLFRWPLIDSSPQAPRRFNPVQSLPVLRRPRYEVPSYSSTVLLWRRFLCHLNLVVAEIVSVIFRSLITLFHRRTLSSLALEHPVSSPQLNSEQFSFVYGTRSRHLPQCSL